MNMKEQIIRSAFRLRLAKKRIESLCKEAKDIGTSAKCDANFLNSLVIQKYFQLEFSVFMPGWVAFVRLDEDRGVIVINYLEKGGEKVVFTTKGWSYQPKGFLLSEGNLYPPKHMITVVEMRRFCSNFFNKYGIEVELMVLTLSPASNPLYITEGRRFHNG